MNKNYERPVAEVISFEAMEQMASLKTEIDSMNIKLEEDPWAVMSRSAL